MKNFVLRICMFLCLLFCTNQAQSNDEVLQTDFKVSHHCQTTYAFRALRGIRGDESTGMGVGSIAGITGVIEYWKIKGTNRQILVINTEDGITCTIMTVLDYQIGKPI